MRYTFQLNIGICHKDEPKRTICMQAQVQAPAMRLEQGDSVILYGYKCTIEGVTTVFNDLYCTIGVSCRSVDFEDDTAAERMTREMQIAGWRRL